MAGIKTGAIVGATLIPVTEDRCIITNGGIVWKEGTIITVGTAGEAADTARRENIPVDRVKDTLIFPGLVNTHTHMYQNLMKGIGADRKLERWWHDVVAPAGIHLREHHAVAAANGATMEALMSGTTTVLDYFQVHPVAGLSEAVIETVRASGLRFVYGRGFRTAGRDQGFPEQLVENTVKVFKETELLRQRYANGTDRMCTIMVAPAAAWALDSKALRETREFCQSTGIGITMHMLETEMDDLLAREKYGMGALEYFDDTGILVSGLLAVHCVHLSEEGISLFRGKGVAVSHNPVSNMYLSSGIAPVPRLREAGVKTGIATDGAASNNTNNMLEILKITALLHKTFSGRPDVLTAWDVLEMATIGGAEALGMEDIIGSLEPGKRADFFLYEPLSSPFSVPIHDPVAQLVYASSSTCVKKVVIDGKVVLDQGLPLNLECEKILIRQQEAAEELFNLCGYGTQIYGHWRFGESPAR